MVYLLSAFLTALAFGAYTQLLDGFFSHKLQKKKYTRLWLLWVAVFFLSSNLLNVYMSGLKFVVEIALYYCFSVLAYQGRRDRHLFVCVTGYAVFFSYGHLFNWCATVISGRTLDELVYDVTAYTLMLVTKAILLFVATLLFKRFHRPQPDNGRPQIWVSLSIIFPLLTLGVLLATLTSSSQQSVWMVCLFILSVVDVIALVLLDSMERSAQDREKLVAIGERTRVQEENIQALSRAYSTQRKLTHDFRAYLGTLSIMLGEGKIIEAQRYLEELKVKQTERILLVNSHNAAIDAILNQKGYIGQQRNIDMRFRVNDLSALHISGVDATMVLGNLLDNAMEACTSQQLAERWVETQILYTSDTPQPFLFISVVNPSKPINIVDNHIPTSKDEPLLHGFGMQNIKEILDRYGAEYAFSCERGRFVFSVDWPDKML